MLKVNYLESIEGLGNLIIKVVPLFTVLSTEIIPPCSWIIILLINNPKPVPCLPLVLEASTL